MNSLNTSIQQTQAYTEDLIIMLTSFIVKPPTFAINDTCKPRILEIPTGNVCKKMGSEGLFNGKVLKQPKRLGLAIQLGFDADTLEIHLNEVYGLVDYIFLLEATRIHYKGYKKPLVWTLLKSQPRFAKFRQIVVNLILDDVESETTNSMSIWALEHIQERKRWERVLEWNGRKKYFGPQDIIGFGDADEIVSRGNLQLLRYCESTDAVMKPVDIGIGFVMGNVHIAFQTDWPIMGYPYSLGDPTFYTVASLMNENGESIVESYPSRNRGQSGQFLVGGLHMTDYKYLPFVMVKKMSCTECGSLNAKKLIEPFLSGADLQPIQEAIFKENEYWKGKGREKLVVELSEKDREPFVVPWFYQCNQMRYPQWDWTNEIDSRLD